MYQNLTLIGHLGATPEMRYLPSGTAVTNFSMATNNNYTNQAGEKVSETTWFRVNAWGKLAENCNQFLVKGSRVMVTGMLVSDKATGGPKTFQRNDGSVSASFEVKANSVLFLSTVGETEHEESGSGNEQAFEDFVL